MIWNAETEYF